MCKVLVTGGAGFIGRWVVKKLIEYGHEVIALDNLSNGKLINLVEFKSNSKFKFVQADILDKELIKDVFESNTLNVCIHLAAQINVQESLINPEKYIENNVYGTTNLLEACRKNSVKLVLMGTCMVYDLARIDKPINEEQKVKPKSPYAASKLCAEFIAESYHYAYRLPIVILRPFNTYGPFQKSNMEGGVVSIFIERALMGKPLLIFGDGTQTRDLLYVEDCAEFVIRAAFSENAIGKIINAGSGMDISINSLADMISRGRSEINHIPHHHPNSEIHKLVSDNSEAKELLGWEPKVSLSDGIKLTEDHIKESHGK